MRKLSREELVQNLTNFIKINIPLEGNKCECGGAVVRKVVDFSRGKFHYNLPECKKCKRIYLYAKNAPTEGEEEFIKLLHGPMTI